MILVIQVPQVQGTADIFRGFMVSLYVKGKENGHVQAYAPNGAMGLKRWGGLTSKLDGLPIASDPHLWWQDCPWRKSLSRKIALTRIKFYGRKLQVKAFPAFGQMQGCADFMRLGAILCPGNFHPWYSITIYSLAKSGLYEMKQHIQSTENIHWTKLGTCETWIVNYWFACTMFIRIVIIQRMLAENKRTVTSGEVISDGIAVLTVGSPYGGNRWIVTSQCSYVKGG